MGKVIYKDEDQELVKIVKERLKDSDKNIKREIKPS